MFVFVEWLGGPAATFDSSILDPTRLPASTREAVSDGSTGIVYVVADELWHLAEPGADPVLLETPYRGAGIFPIISETGQRATLGILARTVAPGAGRPDAES